MAYRSLFLLIALWGFSCGATSTKNVEVNLGTTARRQIPPQFIGLSYEKNTLPTQLFRGNNAGLIALCKRLGPGVLRIGGNSVDLTYWDSTGAGLVKGFIAPADISRLAAFLRAANWKILYGVNLAKSTPALAASEAAFADSILGDRIAGFEIGNEMDLYPKNGDRPTTWTYAQFQAEWDSFDLAILARVPKAILMGPATSNPNSWASSFATGEGKKISTLTFHYYLANGQDSTSTIAKLLAPNPSRTAMLLHFDSVSRNAGISQGYRLAETNSYYNGGAPGVSESYGAGLWALDYLFTLASCGASGVNFHGGGSGTGYTPIANASSGGVVQVRPEYYALSTFDLMAHGSISKAVLSDSSALSAWSAVDSNGTLHIALLNRDSLTTVSAMLHPSAGQLWASSVALLGTHLDSATGVTLGGASIDTSGAWNPVSTTLNLVGDSLQVSVPAASALVLTFHSTPLATPVLPVEKGPKYILTHVGNGFVLQGTSGLEQLDIMDIQGHLLCHLQASPLQTVWQAKQPLPNGIYFVRMTLGLHGGTDIGPQVRCWNFIASSF